MSKNSIEFTK